MEKWPTYGPSWLTKRPLAKDIHKLLSEQKYPICDGNSTGPIITEMQKRVKGSSENADGNTETKIKKIKLLSKKFPIKMTMPCFLPFEKSTFTVEEPLLFPCDPKSYGNRIASFSIGEAQYLISTHKKNSLKQVVLREIKNDKNLSVKYLLKGEKVLGEHNDIYQLDAKSTNNGGFVLTRAPESLSLVSVFSGTESVLKITDTNYASLHPLLDDHFAITKTDSTANIYNIHRNFPLWSGTFNSSSLCAENDTSIFQCQFANHPMYLYVVGIYDAWLADIRISPTNISRKIFCIKSLSKCINYKEEFIHAINAIPNLPYFYATCNQSTLLMDNRYCKTPVVTWQHMMINKPEFTQVFNGENCIKALLLADSKQNSVCIIPTKHIYSHDDVPKVQSLSTPKHFYILKDTLSYAHMNGRWHNEQVLQNIEKQQLVGMTTLSENKFSQSLICFQNNAGFLFYQSITSSKINEKCNKKNILSVLKSYEKVDKYRKNLNLNTTRVRDIKLLARNKGKRPTIHLLKKYNGPLWDINKTSLRNRLSEKWKCILKYERDPTAKERIYNKAEPQLTDFLHSKYHDSLKLDDLKNYSDDISEKLLGPWRKSLGDSIPSKYEEKLGYSFKKLPLNVPDLDLCYVDLSTSTTDCNVTFDSGNPDSVINYNDTENIKSPIIKLPSTATENIKSPIIKLPSTAGQSTTNFKKTKKRSACSGF